FRDASLGSKSIIVIRCGSTLMCFNKIGRVHRATAPKPINEMRFANDNIRGFFVWISVKWRESSVKAKNAKLAFAARDLPANRKIRSLSCAAQNGFIARIQLLRNYCSLFTKT